MAKIVVFLFGVLSYLVFLIAFLYAIGFVGNFYVPKTIDSGTQSALLPSILINLLLLTLFAIQHSVMARPAFKAWLSRFFSIAAERSLYILLSSLALLLLYWQWQPMTDVVWDISSDIMKYVILSVYAMGWMIVLLSTFMINHFELFGLQQIHANFKNKTAPRPQFQTNYFYRISRHPIMLGFVIAFWAAPVMTTGHLLFAVVTTTYIFVAVKFLEEKDLRKAIGEQYEAYQKKVPMIIPFTK